MPFWSALRSKQVQEYLARRLGEAYERFLKTAPSNSYAVVDKDGWRLSAEPTEKLDQEEQDRLDHLKSWLAKHVPHIRNSGAGLLAFKSSCSVLEKLSLPLVKHRRVFEPEQVLLLA